MCSAIPWLAGYSIWDKIEIAGGPDVTLQDVVDHFASTQNMELTMVSIGEALIYAGFMPGHASRPAQRLVCAISAKGAGCVVCRVLCFVCVCVCVCVCVRACV